MSWVFPLQMWWLKPPVRVKSRIVKDDVEVAVPQCSAGWIQVEFRYCVGDFVDRLAKLRVESQRIISEREGGCLKLKENIFVFEEKRTVVLFAHGFCLTSSVLR